MDETAISGILKGAKSSIEESIASLKKIDFTSNWSGLASNATKEEYDNAVAALEKYNSSLDALINCLDAIRASKNNDQEIEKETHTINYYKTHPVRTTDGSPDFTLTENYRKDAYNRRDQAEKRKALNVGIAKNAFNMIAAVNVDVPTIAEAQDNYKYTEIIETINNVFKGYATTHSKNVWARDKVTNLLGASSAINTTVDYYTMRKDPIVVTNSSSGTTSYSRNKPVTDSDSFNFVAPTKNMPTEITTENLNKYSTGYAFPIANGTGYYISSGYGKRKVMWTKAGYTRPFHYGIDIAVAAGTAVHAPLDGEVIECGYGGATGNYVKIKHPDGKTTLYYHLSSYSVKKGQQITQGEEIAKVGSTGRATGPHLHFEVRTDPNSESSAINPYDYLFV